MQLSKATAACISPLDCNSRTGRHAGLQLAPAANLLRAAQRCAPLRAAHEGAAAASSAGGAPVTRRQLAQLLAAAPLLAAAAPAVADEVVTDAPDEFQISVPSGWLSGEAGISGNASFSGSSGTRRTLVYYPEGVPAADVNVTVVVTNVGADFTRLGSFGTVYGFGSSLVNSMDRSYLLRVPSKAGSEPIQVAKLLDARVDRDMYRVDYTVQKLPSPARHLMSLLALGFNGRYNRLYTVTAQCQEDQLSTYSSVLESILGSFVPPPSTAV